jgi:hypothetical protein
MKAFIQKLKPELIDNAKNLAFGLGAFIAVTLIAAIICTALKLEDSTTSIIAHTLQVSLMLFAVGVLGRKIREKINGTK